MITKEWWNLKWPSKKLLPVDRRMYRPTLYYINTSTKWNSSKRRNTSSPDLDIQLSWVSFWNRYFQIMLQELTNNSKLFSNFVMFQIKVSHHDGTPLYDDRNPVKVRHGLTYNNAEYEENKHMLQRNGLIPLVYYPPINATSLGIEASYCIFYPFKFFIFR